MEMENLIKRITEEVVRQLGGLPGASCASAEGARVLKAIDHTLLKPDATVGQISKVCEEARMYGFASVCVNPSHIALVARLLEGSGVAPCCVVGFPLGATMPQIKAAETRACIDMGAKEIDMVINIGAAKSGDWPLVQADIREVVAEAHPRAIVKVIIETCLLTDEEKIKACVCAKNAGADFVKTSTGFASAGATPSDVSLMRRTVGPDMGVKAAGGVRDLKSALEMLSAGATRLGTSNGVSIAKGLSGETTEAVCLKCGRCSGACPCGNVKTVQAY